MANPEVEDTSARALIVDDEAAMRTILSSVLMQERISVTTACDAHEALRLLTIDRFDVAVVDLMMPGMDGISLVTQIRQRDQELPVIILTGQPTLDSAIMAVKASCFRYLKKPFVAEELCAAVREAAALYRLVLLKRHALEHFDASIRPRSESPRLQDQFDEAVAGLWIAFQPIVNYQARQVFGYEALVRTSADALGTPGLLFDAAEQLNRVHEIGRIIRKTVAGTIVQTPAVANVFVNLHSWDLNDDDLFDAQSDLSGIARRVVLEITERASLERVRDVQVRIGMLRRLGYRIAVDDLGAGYAGLSSFTQLEPDIVKLDMSLIRNIDSSARKTSLVRSMIAVCARDLGTGVVCEGVETEAERDRLEELGATLLQGYLFGKPQRRLAIPGGFAPDP
jgi:EAL domain-containing protein (putative c-di-GMP-specific phosphodiesterase class I)